MTKTEKRLLVYNEAMRYIDNAKELLKTKAKLNYVTYDDKKYVRLAGHAAYHGILHAINEAGLIKLKKGQRLDVKDYVAVLAKENGKMKDYFNACYDIFHITAGYDGFAEKVSFHNCIDKYAKPLITWAAGKAAA